MDPHQKAIELISQFGNNAKYVALEIKDNLHWLEDSINFGKASKFWSEVKTEIEIIQFF
jgi:hypothetical protein